MYYFAGSLLVVSHTHSLVYIGFQNCQETASGASHRALMQSRTASGATAQYEVS